MALKPYRVGCSPTAHRRLLASQFAVLGCVLHLCWADAACAEPLEVTQSDAAITISRDDNPILVYNKKAHPVPEGLNPAYRRSGFLHPVNSPKGLTVTATYPADHPHQHGIFSAWVNTSYDGKPVNFWDLAGGTGRVLHEKVGSTFASDDSAGFEVDLIHRMESTPPVEVLRERWKVTVYPTDGDYHCFDLETRQTAITDKPLVIHEYHYGGVAVRGPTRWVMAGDAAERGNSNENRDTSSLVNNHGSDRIQGNHEHARWVAMTGTMDGQPVTIAVLGHKDNFRAPQAARLHPTKPYFVFAPCVDGEFQIDREHPYHARYRYLITDAEPDAKWLNDQWDAWCGK